MKKILIVYSTLFLCVIFSAGRSAPYQSHEAHKEPTPVSIIEPSHTTATLPIDVVWEMLGQISLDRAWTDLRQLTGEEPICTHDGCYTITNRRTGSEGLQWAKDYVHEELVSLGYSVEVLDWSREGFTDQNLIARKPGRFSPDEEIYFIAHMDGVYPSGAVHSPAADDNASGVVSILELARILSSYTFNHTVVLFFSTGEEPGALGVESYVDQLSSAELSAINYIVNVDMIGYDANQDGVMELWAGDHPPSLVFAQELSEIINDYQLNLVPLVVTGCN